MDVVRSNARYRAKGAEDGLPLPPTSLVFLVTGQEYVEAFVGDGRDAARKMLGILQRNNLYMKQFKTILDFGCGCGRVMRHWGRLNGVQVHGTDYNSKLVKWCRRNLAFAHSQTNGVFPPMPYEDSKFDFLYALSILTHLPESHQTQWMADFARVLKPGGYLLLTTHGSDKYLDMLHEEQRRAFRKSEMVLIEGGSVGSNEYLTFHPRKYVLEKLVAGFEVVDFVAESGLAGPQDAWLLKKPLSKS